MIFHDIPYSGETDAVYIRYFIRITLIWYFLGTFLFLLLGAMERDLRTFLAGCFLIFWYLFTLYLFSLFKNRDMSDGYFYPVYIISVTLLAILEETLIYFNGGGLGGTAVSLWHCLSLAVPVFVGIGLGILVVHTITPLTRGEFFVLGAIQGLIIEIIIPANYPLLWWFGGPVMGIYGMMMGCVVPRTPGISTSKSSVVKILIGIPICFFMVILGAVAGDNIYGNIQLMFHNGLGR